MHGEVIWFSDKRIATVVNSLRNNIRREAGYRIIKWTLLKELTPDNPGGWVAGMGDSGGELFNKSCCYISVAGEGFGGKGDGLIGRCFGTFLIRGLIMREGLYLCEHDSTVWVHFCPFDFEMLWRNFSLISCIIIWFRGGRGAERVFFR